MKNVNFNCAGPNPLRFLPPHKPYRTTDFVEGLKVFCENDSIFQY